MIDELHNKQTIDGLTVIVNCLHSTENDRERNHYKTLWTVENKNTEEQEEFLNKNSYPTDYIIFCYALRHIISSIYELFYEFLSLYLYFSFGIYLIVQLL